MAEKIVKALERQSSRLVLNTWSLILLLFLGLLTFVTGCWWDQPVMYGMEPMYGIQPMYGVSVNTAMYEQANRQSEN